METFQASIKYFRELKGYSQTSLAKAIGISRSAYNRLELGKTIPHPLTLKAICDIFCFDKLEAEWLKNLLPSKKM